MDSGSSIRQSVFPEWNAFWKKPFIVNSYSKAFTEDGSNRGNHRFHIKNIVKYANFVNASTFCKNLGYTTTFNFKEYVIHKYTSLKYFPY